MPNPYDLRQVLIGSHELMARPIKWDGEDETGSGQDADGDDITPILYMITCPECAQLIEFKPGKTEPMRTWCEQCELGQEDASAIEQESEEQEVVSTAPLFEFDPEIFGTTLDSDALTLLDKILVSMPA